MDTNNYVHITWHDERDGNREIYYTKLDNNGNTLVDDTRLTTTASADSEYPAIAVDTTNNVHITWYDERDGNYEIYYTKLDNNGNTLVDDTRLTTDSSSYDPAIAVDTSNNVHITWFDYRDRNHEIYYTKLDNNGNTLVDDTRLSSVSAYTHSMYPEIAVDTTNNVHITWQDTRDGHEIYYTKLDNNGNTLVDDTRLTTDSSYSRDPTIAVDTNNNVHITWNDNRDGNYEIYYTKLDNNGNTLVDDTRLTTNDASSWDPTIAVDTNNNVHITWYDQRDGHEIYYKHSIASVTSPTVSIYTDKTSYTAGYTMRLGLDVTNPGDALPVRFAVWLEQPGGGMYVLTYTSVTLPAGCDYSNENFAVITLPSIAAGTYTWNAAIIEPSGPIEFISHDTAEWEFVGRGASTEIADITEAFPAITEIEF